VTRPLVQEDRELLKRRVDPLSSVFLYLREREKKRKKVCVKKRRSSVREKGHPSGRAIFAEVRLEKLLPAEEDGEED